MLIATPDPHDHYECMTYADKEDCPQHKSEFPDPGPCMADFSEITLDCELRAGHEGDHVALFTWPQSQPRPRPPAPGSPGWTAYLEHKYGV